MLRATPRSRPFFEGLESRTLLAAAPSSQSPINLSEVSFASTAAPLAAVTITPGSLSINSGAAYTTNRRVTLTLNAVNATQMRFSADGGKYWSKLQPYASQVAYSLPNGIGTKTILAELRAGTSKVVIKGSIVYDNSLAVASIPSKVTVRPNDTRLYVASRKSDGTITSSKPWVARGVNWSPASIGTLEPQLTAEFAKWYKTDIPLMAKMGVNTVRTYHDFGKSASAVSILNMFYQYGIKVIMTVDSPKQGDIANLKNVKGIVYAFKNHPAILMWAVGNEWDLNHYYGKFNSLEEAAAFTDRAARTIKSLDKNHPVVTFIADPHIPGRHPLDEESFPFLAGPYTKDIVNTLVPNVDIWGINAYRGSSFGDLFSQWRSISSKPMLIGEFGADVYDYRIGAENQAMQASFNAKLFAEVNFNLSATRKDGTAIGALAFEFNDEWWKNGSPSTHTISTETNYGQPDKKNQEEYFGAFDIDRKPRAVFSTFRDLFRNGNITPQLNATPTLTITSQSETADILLELDGRAMLSRDGGQWGGRGITVAVVDQYTGIRLTDLRTFDTWANHDNFQHMIDYVNSLPQGSIVAFGIGDEGGFINAPTGQPWNDSRIEAAYQFLEDLGSQTIRQSPFRGGWSMVTKIGSGVLGEAVSEEGAPAQVSVKLNLALDPNFNLR